MGARLGILGALSKCGTALCVAAALQTGCEREPDLVGEHLRRGDEALAAGEHAQALAAYAHAHELAPTSARVQSAQMWARVHLMADSPQRVGNETLEDIAYEARLLLGSREKLGPERQAVCLAALANVLARRGDVDGAKVKLAEALKVDPASAIAHAALGTLLLGRRELAAEARASFDRALQHRPESATALVGLGQLQLADGDVAGAAARFETALRHRDDPAIRAALGRAWLQQGKHVEAAAQLERATSADPKSADAWSGLGQALLGAGRLDEAERALRTAMSLRADEPTAIALGFTLARLKRADQALAVFAQVLAQNPSAAPALYGAGIASEDLGRVEQAADYYRRVLALPAEGAQKQIAAELQKEAKDRMEAIASLVAAQAAAAPSASVRAPASAEPAKGAARSPK